VAGGRWGFAKGRRDPGDAHEIATAIREAREETGYSGLSLHGDFRVEIEYVVRGDGTDDYRKRVAYFLAPAPDTDPVLSDEHDRHVWASELQAVGLIRYGQLRDLARAVFGALQTS
jgi:8-oxo-dGTP pyrophosphatase MutT (NUDIX family)